MKQVNFSEWGDNMMIIPQIMCIIGCCCLLTPVRKFLKEKLNACINKYEEEPEGETYVGKSLQFTDCYDIANPLTYKQGKLRLLKV